MFVSFTRYQKCSSFTNLSAKILQMRTKEFLKRQHRTCFHSNDIHIAFYHSNKRPHISKENLEILLSVSRTKNHEIRTLQKVSAIWKNFKIFLLPYFTNRSFVACDLSHTKATGYNFGTTRSRKTMAELVRVPTSPAPRNSFHTNALVIFEW